MTGKTGKSKPPVATHLVNAVRKRYRLAISTEGEPFAVPLVGPPVPRMLRGGSDSLRAAMAADYADRTRRAPSQTALTDALVTIEGYCQRETPEPLELRVAATDNDSTLWLDLGDDTGRAVKVTRDGWRVAGAPVLFRHTALTAPLPEPAAGGTLDDLWTLLNVDPEDRPVVAAVLVAALLPGIPHPVTLLTGEQGTGKSTASRILAGLLDPSRVPLRKAPRDVEGWTAAAAGSWVVAVDNVSGLQDWFSDALCRAVTGDGDVRRRLYTDGDLHVVAFRRCVIINGIDLGAVRDDLADRLVTVNLHRIPDRSRRFDADVTSQWQEAHPRVLGAVLDLAARVLAVIDDVDLPSLPRMADFARVLAAVDHVLGTRGLDRYRSLAGNLASDAVTGDPVLAAITEHVTGPWTGTSADLHHLITDSDQPRGRDWPDPRKLTGILRRRAPSMRRVGWTVEDLGRRGKACALHFRLVPPRAATAGADDVDTGKRQASDRQAASVTLAESDPLACLPAPVLTCGDTQMASKASETSKKPDDSLCLTWIETEEREKPGTSLASPPCVHCDQPIGELRAARGYPTCADCRDRAAS